MFKILNADEILQSLQLQCSSSLSKVEGTFEYDVFSSNAIEFMKTYVELGELYKVAFGNTAYGDFLTQKAAEAGVIRKDATKSTGQVTVTGKGRLPMGSQFATQDGVLFETIREEIINGVSVVPIRAVEGGKEGNVGSNTITVIPLSIPGMTSVTNDASTVDGFDKETDEELRNRYFIHVRTPGTSGNKFHYYEWAMSVPGVGAAKILPIWNGPGTVKVIVVDSNFSTASEQLLGKVRSYIDSVRPFGAIVTVETAMTKKINISAHVEGSLFDVVKFKTMLLEYFVNLEKAVTVSDVAVKVSASKVGSMILASGAEDYDSLTLNGMSANIQLQSGDIPAVGEVTIT